MTGHDTTRLVVGEAGLEELELLLLPLAQVVVARLLAHLVDRAVLRLGARRRREAHRRLRRRPEHRHQQTTEVENGANRLAIAFPIGSSGGRIQPSRPPEGGRGYRSDLRIAVRLRKRESDLGD